VLIFLTNRSEGAVIHANAAMDSLVPKAGAIFSSKLRKQRYNKTQKISNQTYISKTDPDASLARKRGKARALRYKIHNAIDSHSRIILDSKVTTGACHDSIPFLSQLEEISTKYSLKIEEVVADRAYGSGSILTQLEEKNIKSYVPLFNTKTGKSYALEKDGFKYNSNQNLYICPNNKTMLPYKRVSTKELQRLPTC
jgi:hypothetical protein